MSYLKNLFLIVLVAVAAVGFLMVAGIFYTHSTASNSSTSESVVYIENGVSGIVTINDPFLNKTTAINVIFYPLDSGSGFVVNNQGYVITALHVVGDLDALNNQTIKTMDNSDIQKYVERAAVMEYVLNLNPQLGFELNVSNEGLLGTALDANATTEILRQRNLVSVSSSEQVIKVKFPNSTDSLNATLIDAGSTVYDQDIALLKINSNNNYVPLSISSDNPSIFQSVSIYGYPVTNNVTTHYTNNSIIKTSVSSGFVTSKTFKNGTNPQEYNSNLIYDNFINFLMLIFDSQSSNNISSVYYGTNAKTEEGFSGGPVVDNQNKVMGILIFSVNSNNQLQNEIKLTSSLFLSPKYIIDICKKNNVSFNVA